jgi:ankyrin repeat protein
MPQYGTTAVNLAADYGHLKVVELLLDNGACIATPDKVSCHV